MTLRSAMWFLVYVSFLLYVSFRCMCHFVEIVVVVVGLLLVTGLSLSLIHYHASIFIIILHLRGYLLSNRNLSPSRTIHNVSNIVQSTQ